MYVIQRLVAVRGCLPAQKSKRKVETRSVREGGFAYREILIAVIGFRICTRTCAIPAIFFPTHDPLLSEWLRPGTNVLASENHLRISHHLARQKAT
jgi:hypothetical protein